MIQEPPTHGAPLQFNFEQEMVAAVGIGVDAGVGVGVMREMQVL
jgi:hypothetical protein